MFVIICSLYLTNTCCLKLTNDPGTSDWKKALEKRGDPVLRCPNDKSIGCIHTSLADMTLVDMQHVKYYSREGGCLHKVSCSNRGCKQGKLFVTVKSTNGKTKTKISWKKGTDGSYARCCKYTLSARCTCVYCYDCVINLISKEGSGKRARRNRKNT